MEYVQIIVQNVKHFQDVKFVIMDINYIEENVLIIVQFIQIY